MSTRSRVLQTVLVGGALSFAPALFAQAVTGYRVQMVLHEMQDGKPAATRTYTLMVRPGNSTSVSVGNRVPVKSDGDKYNYENTGLTMSMRPAANQSEGSLALDVSLNITTVAPAGTAANVYLPILRTASSNVSAVLTLGKPTTVSSIEDLNSNASYELEITADKSSVAAESGPVPPAPPPADHQHR